MSEKTTTVKKHQRKTKTGRTSVKRHPRKIKYLDENMRKSFETLARNKKREYGTGWDLDRVGEGQIIDRTSEIHRGKLGGTDESGKYRGRGSTTTPNGVDVTVHTHPAHHDDSDYYNRPSGADISILIRDTLLKGKDEAFIISPLGRWYRYRVIDPDQFKTAIWQKRIRSNNWFENADKVIESQYATLRNIEESAMVMTPNQYATWVKRGRPTKVVYGKWQRAVIPTKYDGREEKAREKLKALQTQQKKTIETANWSEITKDDTKRDAHNRKVKSEREQVLKQQKKVATYQEKQVEEQRLKEKRFRDSDPKYKKKRVRLATRRTWNQWRSWVEERYNVEIDHVKKNKDGTLSMSYRSDKTS